MSNATQQARKPGEGRRRRSRGGRNRNKQHQPGSRAGNEKSNKGQGQGPRPSRGRARRPVQLSWWQKILKAIGLYREPEPAKKRSSEPQAAKSNIRNARGPGREAKPRDKESASKRSSRGGNPATVESARVYVGNLSYDVTEQDLQELFKGIGGVRSVEIIYNRSTHRSKGYGFVEMLHRDEAVRAVEVLHDQPFMGRKLNVSGAKSKGEDEREERGGQATENERIVSLAPLPEADAPTAETQLETSSPEPAKATEDGEEPAR